LKNKYEVIGDFAKVYVETKYNGTVTTLIDLDDLKKLIDMNVRITAARKNRLSKEHVFAFRYENKGVLLHRFVMNAPKGTVVDHIFHDSSDNRKSQLRVCTNAENCQNKSNAYSNTGYRNVHRLESGKFVVTLTVNKKTNHIGVFADIEEANRAAIEARKKLMPFSTK